MSEKKDDGGPVFPPGFKDLVECGTGMLKDPQVGRIYKRPKGISVRTWLAGQALNGLLANPNLVDREWITSFDAIEGFPKLPGLIADRVLQELKK